MDFQHFQWGDQTARHQRRVITDQKALEIILPHLRETPWIAIDTEADSLHAYPEKLCLLQISTAEEELVVDPLAGLDLEPLMGTLRGRELLFHAADYDLRLLRKWHGFSPASVFDTMIAARLLGYPRFGLADLVERHLGLKLEKGPQKMDWAQRPLTPRMLEYARNDTRHLKQLADQIRDELVEKGRLAWHEESCARLVRDIAGMDASPDPDAWRMRGSDRFDPRSLMTMKYLWEWREREALAANRPPFFILNHDLLLDLATDRRPIPEVATCLPPRMNSRRRSGVMKAIEEARLAPLSECPTRRRREFQHPTIGEQRRFLELREHRDKVAAELEMDPTLIASRATLMDLATRPEETAAGLMGWQLSLMGLQPAR